MASHKKQHFVPKSYLKPWCDPSTPTGQEPYVWRFNKDGSDPRRKAPENLFHETDLYTIQRVDGERDLVLEHGLAELESAFVTIRESKLCRRHSLTRSEFIVICAFVAAATARTPTLRDHHAEHWTGVLQMMGEIQESVKGMTPAQRTRSLPPLLPGSGPTFGHDEVKLLAEKPMQTMLLPSIRVMTPLLAQLGCVVLESQTDAIFITSDNPCAWFDPEAYKRPPLYRGPGLAFPSLEIILPLSPRYALVLNRRVPSGYFGAGDRAVDEMNRRTRAYCSEYFVSNSSRTRPIWFDDGVEPEDSWEKQEARKRAGTVE